MQGLWLLILPVAATCGWFAGRNSKPKDFDEMPLVSNLNLHQDYYAGLNYLINEQPDKAVDVFIKLLEADSDTVETHLALGSLFRRRGEVDRAIRVHQNLIARPQLSPVYRLQALLALAQDYLRAGVLDRAERLFRDLSKHSEYQLQSLYYLLKIYQQEKEWSKSIEVAEELQSLDEKSIASVIAQFNCELAEKSVQHSKWEAAEIYLKNALSADKNCVRATLIKAKIARNLGKYQEAIRLYQRIKKQDLAFLSETVSPMIECYSSMNNIPEMVKYFSETIRQYPDIISSLAASHYFDYQFSAEDDLNALLVQLKSRPSLQALHYLLNVYASQNSNQHNVPLKDFEEMVSKMLSHKHSYRCVYCGLVGKMLHWLCPGCEHWGTVKPLITELD